MVGSNEFWSYARAVKKLKRQFWTVDYEPNLPDEAKISVEFDAESVRKVQKSNANFLHLAAATGRE